MSAVGGLTPGDTPELRLRAITKNFGPTRALDGASFALHPGTVHALLGENGAGKTTLMRIAFGLLRPDTGEILLGGRSIRVQSPSDAIRAGIGMVHQHFTHVPTMTVAENIALGGHGRFSHHAAAAQVRQLTAATRLALDPDATAQSLSIGAQQRLEILKAISRRARILIMDEPTAVLAPDEAAELLAWLREFARGGGSVVLITHKLAEALAIADEVTVLRFGRTVLSSVADQVSSDQLASAMLGESPHPERAAPPNQAGRVILRASSLTLCDTRGVVRIAEATFTVGEHEIVGIAALEDSGHQYLLRAIAGRLAPSSGALHVDGPVALIPEDRHRDALIESFSLVENFALRGAGKRRGRINWEDIRSRANRFAREFDVRASSVDISAGALSGGNQQKLVLARELSERPALIVAENPTRGLDIRATASVHERLREAATHGSAVIVHSTDLDEVLALATRILAVHAGRVVEVPNERDAAGKAMVGLFPETSSGDGRSP